MLRYGFSSYKPSPCLNTDLDTTLAMTTKYTVTLSRMGTSSVIAVPKPVVDGFGLVKGEKLDVYVTDKGILIPLKPRELGIEDALEALKHEKKGKTK